MNFRLTIVVDNNSSGQLVAEHGYSLHIETPEGNILLDTGQKDAFLPNMEQLGLDAATILHLVLSHGHYDHTGGVAELLSANRSMDIYLHSAVFQPRYSLDGEAPSIVKMPFTAMEAITRHNDERVHWLNRPLPLSAAVGITGPISRQNDFEDTGGSFYLDPDGHEVDTIKDDIALWLHGPEGLIVCVGCCHSGLVNTLNHITARTGEKRIAMVIGGLHLLHATAERLEKTVEGLAAFDIQKIVACHCSGDQAVHYLRDHLDVEVVTGYAGMTIDV